MGLDTHSVTTEDTEKIATFEMSSNFQLYEQLLSIKSPIMPTLCLVVGVVGHNIDSYTLCLYWGWRGITLIATPSACTGGGGA